MVVEYGVLSCSIFQPSKQLVSSVQKERLISDLDPHIRRGRRMKRKHAVDQLAGCFDPATAVFPGIRLCQKGRTQFATSSRTTLCNAIQPGKSAPTLRHEVMFKAIAMGVDIPRQHQTSRYAKHAGLRGRVVLQDAARNMQNRPTGKGDTVDAQRRITKVFEMRGHAQSLLRGDWVLFWTPRALVWPKS